MKPTLVVFVDLSPRSQRAAQLAATLAVAVGGQLLLLYVEAEVTLEPELGQVFVAEQPYRQLQLDAHQALAELARQLPVAPQIEYLAGNLPEVLTTFNRRWHPQLLVLGVAPEHSVFDELLVNPALPALRDTELPLLLVPENPTHEPALPLHVAFAADGQPFQLRDTSRYLALLLPAWAASSCVVHVAAPDDPAGTGILRAVATVQENGLVGVSKSCGRYQVAHQPPAAGLVQATEDVQADLLVLFTRSRSLLGSTLGWGVASRVARTCPVPLLLLPTLPPPYVELPPAHRLY